MFKTLYGKIALILSGLFLFIGILYIVLTIFTTRLYIQEGAQRLNHDLAKYLVSKMFFIEDGKVNEKSLKESFDMLMNINHNIEVYLLDKKGNLLAYSAPEGKVKRKSVSLIPIKHFLQGTHDLPILGDDPRLPGRQKIFSASPVPLEGPLDGYLYIILGSEEYDSIAFMLQKSYILRLSTSVATAGLLFVFITGLFLFWYLTKRLHKLSTELESFKKSDFIEPFSLTKIFKKKTDDEIYRLGMVFEDMSHRIIEQINRIKQADTNRRELISNISHDIRTPLSSLHGYLETLLLKGEKISAEDKKLYLETAYKHSKRLGKLISELFELAKLDSGETMVNLEPFHPGELIQDMTQKYKLISEKKSLSISTEFPKDIPFASADIGLIERAIQNLMDNAIRHTKEGGKISLILTPQESNIKVEVKDNGCGISEDDLPHIFERFFRAKTVSKKDSGSAGLGLAITKRIIELHGSDIKVKSEIGSGTTFTFFLDYHKSNK